MTFCQPSHIFLTFLTFVFFQLINISAVNTLLDDTGFHGEITYVNKTWNKGIDSWCFFCYVRKKKKSLMVERAFWRSTLNCLFLTCYFPVCPYFWKEMKNKLILAIWKKQNWMPHGRDKIVGTEKYLWSYPVKPGCVLYKEQTLLTVSYAS